MQVRNAGAALRAGPWQTPPMRVTYDPEVDAAYIYVREAEARLGTVKSVPVPDAPGMIVLDFDTDGRLFGIEVLDASQLLPSELLTPADTE